MRMRKSHVQDKEESGRGFGAFAVFRRVRDATRAVRRPLKPALNLVTVPLGSLLAYLYIEIGRAHV